MNVLLNRLLSLRVHDVMSRGVVNVPAGQTMDDAARTFAEHHISGAPVVDDAGGCVGVLSAFDFVAGRGDHDSVEGRMSSPVQSIKPESPMLDAARQMCHEHVHRIIVVDEAGRPVATVTALDIVAALINAYDESAG